MDPEVPTFTDAKGYGIFSDFFGEDESPESMSSKSYQNAFKKIKVESSYLPSVRSSEKISYPTNIYSDNKRLQCAPSHIVPQYEVKKPKRNIHDISSRQYNGYIRTNTEEYKSRRCPNPGRRGPRGKSSYRGVCITREGKWRSVIYKDRKQVYLGVYDSELEAAQAYDRASREYFGENANLNLPNEVPRDLGPIVLPSAAKAEKSAAQKAAQQNSCPPNILVPKSQSKPQPQLLDQTLDFDSIFEPDNILDGQILGDDIGPMSPIPSLFEGEWHDNFCDKIIDKSFCFV